MTVHVASPGGPVAGAIVTFSRFTIIALSPGPFEGSSTTGSEGDVEFVVFVHDTDRFTFTAEAEGFGRQTVVFGGGARFGGLELWRTGGRVEIALLPE